MNTHIIMQARMGSTRLPGKVMKSLAGKPVLWHDIERCRASKRSTGVIIATTTNPEDDEIERVCREWGVDYFRGSWDDVLSRYYGAATKYRSDVVVRVTSDCPLIDPAIIDLTIEGLGDNDYVTNVLDRNFPRGMDAEVFTMAALTKAQQEATKEFDREHVTPFIREHAGTLFKTKGIDMPDAYHFPQFRLTLDTPEDYALFTKIYDAFYRDGELIDVPSVLRWLNEHPEIAAINAEVKQKHDPTQK